MSQELYALLWLLSLTHTTLLRTLLLSFQRCLQGIPVIVFIWKYALAQFD